MPKTDVLIVGAGPTGLTLACRLAEQGVAFRIIDSAESPPAGSRGKGLQPRSLELFDTLGVVDRIVANGSFDIAVQRHGGGAAPPADGPDWPPRPDAPYRKSLITPQWRVEETLRARLEELGGQVEFGVELTDFTQDESGVAASLAQTGGAETVEALWLVGCDGGKSSVRHIAGIAFLGKTLQTHRMIVADMHVAGVDSDHWHMWSSPEGMLALCPLPSTDVFQLQASIAPNQTPGTTLEEIQRTADARTGRTDIRLSAPSWVSLWRANLRIVDRYRAGRVFLAGDAAHCHSPAGGQGMNTGIQDAFNLSWKLASVIGGADAALLDTYEEERLPIARDVLELSNTLMQATVAAGSFAFRRDDRTAQLSINYRADGLTRELRPDGDGLRAGDRAPQAPGLVGPQGPCSLFDLLRGSHATVLGFGARWAPVLDACAARFGKSLRAYAITAEGDGGDGIVDQHGHARAAFGEDALFVVRPDNYIGLATVTVDEKPIIDYLQAILPVDRPG